MRIWHSILMIAGLAVLFTLVREPLTRAFLIVFLGGVCEVGVGLLSTTALTRTVGAFGEAQSFYDHAEAVFATLIVLLISSVFMAGMLFIGWWMVLASV